MQNDPFGANGEALPAISRRLFLRTAASASIATAAAGGALAVQVASAAAKPSAEARAKRAWEEFCDAMREIAADADGWVIIGAAERWTKEHPNLRHAAVLNIREVHLVQEPVRPGHPQMMTVERHKIVRALTDPRLWEIDP